MATVGTLIFEISANLARLQADMDKARGTVDNAMNGIKSAAMSAKAVLGALGVTATAVGFANMISGAIQSMEALLELSQKSGATVEALSALRLVAKQSGTDMEQVGAALQKLSRNMLEASDGNSKAGRAFDALGVNVRTANGNLRSSEQVMQEVSGRLVAMENKTLAVAYAQEIFGKAGANLLPFMHQLSEAGQLNAEVTTEQAEAADKFGDSMARLEKKSELLKISLANRLLPTLNTLADVLLNPNQKVDVPWWDTMFAKSTVKINEWMIAMEKGTAKVMRLAGLTKGADMHDAIAADLQKGIDKINGESRDKALASYRAGERGSYGARTPDDMPGPAAGGGSGAGDAAGKDKNPWYDPEKAAAAREKYLQQVEDAATKAWESETAAAQASLAEQAQMEARAMMARLRMMDEVEAAADKAWKEQQKAAQKVDDITQRLGLTMSSAFEAAILKGKSLRDVLGGVASDMAQIVLRQTITKPAGEAIVGAIGSSGVGDFFKNIFGGARASGGPVSAGSAYLVGEQGPELMVPGSSGTIVPNGALGGGTYIIDARGADAEGMARLERMIRQMNGTIEQRAVSAVANAAGRSGSYSRSLAGA